MTLIQPKNSAPFQPSSLRPAELTAAGPRAILEAGFATVDTVLDDADRTLWIRMRPRTGLACFSLDLLQDLQGMHRAMRALDREAREAGTPRLRYFVAGSGIPGIYNLGGDLGLFARRIRQNDRATMSHYAHACIDLICANTVHYDLPAVTIALIQGDALGGGFEMALAHDVIVAERDARIGLPEILFNLFPGMGAYSLLSRRLNPRAAERMILSGRIYTGAELHEMGVVDVLAENGDGEAETRRFIERTGRRHNAHAAINAARRCVNPVTEKELRDVVDIWVEAALNLGPADLRKMERLAAAQGRRLENAPGADLTAAAE